MELVEREMLLAELQGLLDEARGGEGRLALVGGEAGAGKTSLVQAFAAGLPTGVRLLWGTCDPLSTPRPLAPFRDMAASHESVGRLLAGRRERHAVLSGLLDELGLATVAVVEDAHWADEATLDALRFIGRRVHTTRGLVVVTYRDDEVPADHRLRAVLGDLATAPGCRRLTVPLLSLDGVAALARGKAYEPHRLHRVTGGNPFYVTEVLAAPAWVLPQTVSDAVLARARRLSEEARRLLWTVSLSPGGLEPSLAGGNEGAHDECLGSGMLLEASDRLTFRHELARRAIEESVPAGTRRRLHLRLLGALERGVRPDPARLAHHAHAAGDAERTLRYAVEAARQAASRGAHREAARHYEAAATYADRLDPGDRADLLLAWSLEHLGDPDQMLRLRREAVELRRQTGDERGAARAQVVLSGGLWAAARAREAAAVNAEALATLERLPPGPELAEAYAWQARLAMLASRNDEVERWAPKAIELAERLGDRTALLNGLIARGVTRLARTDLSGVDLLERAGELALETGDDYAYARVLDNTASCLATARLHDRAIAYFERSLSFSADRDLDVPAAYATAGLARIRFQQGAWSDAEHLAERASELGQAAPFVHAAAQTILGRLACRRGAPAADDVLEQAWTTAVRIDELQRLWPVACGRAERAWLQGRPDATPGLVGETFELALSCSQPWPIGELAFWLWRAGILAEPPEDAAEPYALQIAGSWRAAAAAWRRLGCPYERAEALADGDEPAQREALDLFTQLGAEPAAERLRRQMRGAGLAGVPARPRAATRDAPAQLTARQLEVLGLVAAGQTNAEIAGRLFITEKTAGHHVSAILRKLGVRSRTEAAAAAHQLGIAAPDR